MLGVEFSVRGIPCLGLNGGPAFRHDAAFSFLVATDDQAVTDRLRHAIVNNGGQASACGWCKDRRGLSWQITPQALIAATTAPDRAAAKRVVDAMAMAMAMGKIDIATIDAARPPEASSIQADRHVKRPGAADFDHVELTRQRW